MSAASAECTGRCQRSGKDSAPTAYSILNVIFLFLFLAALVTLASLQITSDSRVGIPGTSRVLSFPCYYVSHYGVRCPSCGITRSLIAAAHGEFKLSHHFHPAGAPLLLLLLAQCAMRIAFLRPRLRRPALDVTVSLLMAIYLAWALNSR